MLCSFLGKHEPLFNFNDVVVVLVFQQFDRQRIPFFDCI